jgi:thiol-disulfide isomerase/thioredoxin
MRPPDLPDIYKIHTFPTKADLSLKFNTLNGDKIELNDFKGKVIFLNIWATWCPPCIEEMPSIQKLYNKTDHDTIEFILLSPENSETVKKFLNKSGYTFDVYLLTDELPEVFYTGQIPTTYIIDKNGNIVYRHIGFAIWDNIGVINFLESLKNN